MSTFLLYAVIVASGVFITSIVLVSLVRSAPRLGLVDHPHGRKRHPHPTPVVGGLAMAIGATVIYPTLWFVSAPVVAFLIAAAILTVTGILDDLHDLRWWWRIGAQVIAAFVLIQIGGVQVEQIGRVFEREPTSLGMLSIPVTVVATVGVINALNMCDGADGLAGSLALAAMTMIMAAAMYVGNDLLAQHLMPVMGAILAFLWFNVRVPWRPNAAVFMGNAGSAFLGLTIVWATFRLTQHTEHVLTPVLAPYFLAPPIIDCLTLIMRRLKAGKSPFHADRGHMHHLLQDAGFSPGQIALLLCSTSFALGLGAALAVKAKIPEYWLVIIFIAMTFGYYWLTAKRARVRHVFGGLYLWLVPKRVRATVKANRVEEF
jgi:UDP-GlcNAc:undecaprenyl-phosphate/decaprenyl-phosphate GlcNAc-1-phosphate transferase